MLREGIAFLNHGSFGAVPRVVFEEQERWRRRIEAEPIEMLGRRHAELMEEAKRPLGELLNMRGEEFGLVTNATEGVNAVLSSLRFKSGDELLTTDHVYNAVRQAMRHAALRDGAAYREVAVRTPVHDAQEIARSVLDAVNDRTRLVVIDHVTSPTGLIFPVNEIVAGCAARGVEVLIDGAHAPGMIDLDVPATGAAYYAGNLHKWCCAPKGCAFLWVTPSRRADIHPCVVSHNYGKGLAAEFGWQGTRDASAWLSIPAAMSFMAGSTGSPQAQLGWERVRAHNHALAVWAQQMLCERFRVEPLSPLDGRLIGATATVRLPDRLAASGEDELKKLQRWLHDERQVEVPFFVWQGAAHLRVSCQVYTAAGEVERMATAVEEAVNRFA